MLVSCWFHVGFMLVSCWFHVGFMLGSCWVHVGFMFDSCWTKLLGCFAGIIWFFGNVTLTVFCRHHGSRERQGEREKESLGFRV